MKFNFLIRLSNKWNVLWNLNGFAFYNFCQWVNNDLFLLTLYDKRHISVLFKEDEPSGYFDDPL